MNSEEQIKSWLHRVDSEKYLSSELVTTMMENIAGLNAFDIGNYIELVAYLFCNVLRKCGEIEVESVSLAVDRAFDSIQKMDTEKEYVECADIKTIQFLRKIYYKNIEGTADAILSQETIRNDFQLLAENLERISIIFKLQINEQILFQMGTLLKDIITKWNPNNFSLSLEEMNVIFLAIQIFQFHQDEEIDAMLEIVISKYNLKFLEYMRQTRTVLLGGAEYWRSNYLKNGVLVIADVENHKILIRSESRDYIGSGYDSEKNSSDQEIAYFKEIAYDTDFTFCDAREILQRGNEAQLRNLIKIMMSGYVNVFIEKSLLVKDDEIQIVNECSIKDKYLILQDGSVVKSSGFACLEEYLEPYRFRALAGKHIDCITLGVLVSLQKIHPVEYNVLFPEEIIHMDNMQNRVIMNWLQNVSRPLSGWYQLKEFYYNELRYVNLKKDYLAQDFCDLRLYPIQLNCGEIQAFLLHILFPESCQNGELHTAIVKKDFEDGIVFEIIREEVPERIDSIEWLDKNFENQNFEEGDKIALWYDGINSFYAGTELNRLVNTISEARMQNERLLPFSFLSYIADDEIKDIQSYMQLQKEGLIEQCGFEGDFEYIARFRIAQQLCYFQITEMEKYNNYVQMIRRHNKLDFDFLAAKKGRFFENGTLYIPKERADRQGTLWYINERLLKSDARREKEYLYYDVVDCTEDGIYTFKGEIIKKIVFLFDTLQSGTATKRSISCYFEHKNDVDWSEDGKRHTNYAQKYYDTSGNEVFVEDIIKANSIEKENIVVYCFYGTEKGIGCVTNYCNERGSGHDCLNGAVVVKEKTITANSEVTEVDLRILQDLFKRPSITNGSYMIMRKYNAAKQNIFPDEALVPEHIISIFMKKRELAQ